MLDIPLVAKYPHARGNDAILNALDFGNIHIVNRLLDFKEVRDLLSINNNHALRVASALGDVQLVWYLLDVPCVQEQLKKQDSYALYWAIKNKHIQVIEVLMSDDLIRANISQTDFSLLFRYSMFSLEKSKYPDDKKYHQFLLHKIPSPVSKL